MLVRFNNEVLRRSREAMLPANLTAEWLEILANEAEGYLEGRTDQVYFCLALVASRMLIRLDDACGPSAHELDRFVRRYALDILEERAVRSSVEHCCHDAVLCR